MMDGGGKGEGAGCGGENDSSKREWRLGAERNQQEHVPQQEREWCFKCKTDKCG